MQSYQLALHSGVDIDDGVRDKGVEGEAEDGAGGGGHDDGARGGDGGVGALLGEVEAFFSISAMC